MLSNHALRIDLSCGYKKYFAIQNDQAYQHKFLSKAIKTGEVITGV